MVAKALGRFENVVILVVLALMSALPLLEIAARKTRGGGIPGSVPIVQHLTLLIAFLGAALAARSDRLLAFSTADLLPERFRELLRVGSSAVAIGVTTSLVVASLALVGVEREAEELVAIGIPIWIVLLAMPVGLVLVIGRLIRHASKSSKYRWLAASGLLVPAVLALVSPSAAPAFVAPAAVVLLLATVAGMPIFAVLAGFALLLFWAQGIPVAAVSVEAYRLSAEPMLPAIPLFTLGGYILAEGGASRRLMRSFDALFGWLPGGLAIVTTLILAFFTPLTGASGVTILSMGGLLLPVLVSAKYPEKSSIGLVTVSGSIGLLFIPSLPVILYGVYSNTSIPRLFVGGLVPGMLLVLAVAGWGASRGVRAGAKPTPFDKKRALAALWEAKWELFLPVVIIIGIFGGFATLVEASALTVLYALVVECFVYRDLSIRRDVPRVALESATLVGGFLIILGSALGFTNFLIHAEVPTRAVHWVQTYVESPLVFLLVLNLFLIAVGALMDIYSAIFVIVPLIAPMGVAYGIDPVHLGIVFLANMELGYLMPPMGENLFLSSYRFKQPLMRIYVSTGPYVLIIAAVVLLVTYVPALTLWPLRLLD